MPPIRRFTGPSGFGRARHRFVEPANDTRLAERDHGVEERRSDGLPYNGNAGGVDQQRGLHPRSLGDGASSVIAGVVIPFLEIS